MFADICSFHYIIRKQGMPHNQSDRIDGIGTSRRFSGYRLDMNNTYSIVSYRIRELGPTGATRIADLANRTANAMEYTNQNQAP